MNTLIRPLPALETQVDAWCLFSHRRGTEKLYGVSVGFSRGVLRSGSCVLTPTCLKKKGSKGLQRVYPGVPWCILLGQPHFLLHVAWRMIWGEFGGPKVPVILVPKPQLLMFMC